MTTNIDQTQLSAPAQFQVSYMNHRYTNTNAVPVHDTTSHRWQHNSKNCCTTKTL